MIVTLRHIRIFLAVCKYNNVTMAAKELFIAQPAASLAIKELEEYYGIKLFDRISKRLYITEPGKKFLSYASHITSLFDEMEKELKCHDLVNNLKIGATIATGTYFMPKYVEKFAEIRPGIKINVYIENSKVIENKLLTNELDLAIIDGIIHSENIISDPILDDKLVIICSPKNPLAQKETVSLEEIKNQNFLLRERGSGTRELFDSILFSRGITIEPLWESISTRALVIAVQQNIGIAVLPYYLVKEELEKKIVSRVRIKNIKFVRKFNIIHHKNKYLSSSAISFIKMCKNMEK